MTPSTHRKLAGLLLISFLGACGAPSRDSAVTKTARKVCKRADQCGTLPDSYDSFGECRSDWEDNLYDTWPDRECADGQIDPEQLDECHVQIETFDCDNRFADLIVLLLTSCNKSQVCTN